MSLKNIIFEMFFISRAYNTRKVYIIVFLQEETFSDINFTKYCLEKDFHCFINIPYNYCFKIWIIWHISNAFHVLFQWGFMVIYSWFFHVFMIHDIWSFTSTLEDEISVTLSRLLISLEKLEIITVPNSRTKFHSFHLVNFQNQPACF